MSEIEDLEKLMEECASKLGEHADSVRIFVTKHADESTGESASLSTGRGSFYAQLGLVHEWLIRQDENVRYDSRKSNEEDDK